MRRRLMLGATYLLVVVIVGFTPFPSGSRFAIV